MECDEVPSRLDKLLKFRQESQTEEVHWVRCKGFRCLAIPTKDGKWKCFATGEELSDVIEVLPD